jgi:hypothetical protein
MTGCTRPHRQRPRQGSGPHAPLRLSLFDLIRWGWAADLGLWTTQDHLRGLQRGAPRLCCDADAGVLSHLVSHVASGNPRRRGRLRTTAASWVRNSGVTCLGSQGAGHLGGPRPLPPQTACTRSSRSAHVPGRSPRCREHSSYVQPPLGSSGLGCASAHLWWSDRGHGAQPVLLNSGKFTGSVSWHPPPPHHIHPPILICLYLMPLQALIFGVE